jgi:hypothetical protein
MWKGAVRGTRTLLSVQTILPMMNGQGPKALPYRFPFNVRWVVLESGRRHPAFFLPCRSALLPSILTKGGHASRRIVARTFHKRFKVLHPRIPDAE